MYFFGLNAGLRLIRKLQIKEAFRLIVIPVSYWRALEYRMFFDLVDLKKGIKILDIGSPKLLSLYLAKKYDLKVYATDIHPYFLETYSLLRRLLHISKEAYQLQREDGRNLSFEDSCFDLVYSISVLEHIPDEGDSKCMKEVARVLRPGGKCFLTVPFSPVYREVYTRRTFYWSGVSSVREDGQLFYERRYDEQALFDRLINPSGLHVDKLFFVGERIFKRSTMQMCDLLHPITGPVQPILSKIIHTKPVKNWQELDKPLCAVLLLRKE